MPPKSSPSALPTKRTLRTTARKANPIPNSPIPTPKTSAKSTTKSPPASASRRSAGGAKPTTNSPSPAVHSLASPSSNKSTTPLPTAGGAQTTTATPSPPVPSLVSPSRDNPTPLASSQPANVLNLSPKSTIGEPATNILNLNPNSTSGDAAANVLNLKPKSTSDEAANLLNLNPKSTSGEGVSKGNQKSNSSPQTASTELKSNPKSSSAEKNASIDRPSVPVSSQSNPAGEICEDETLGEKVTEATPVIVEGKSTGENGVETAPAGTKKTVMKKTVRVVKRVVKKKVPKKKEQIASSNEELQNQESSKDGEMPNSSVTSNDIEFKGPMTPVESVLMEVEKDNPIDTITPEIENSKTNVIDSMDSMEVEKRSDDSDIQMNAENQKDIEMKVEKPSDGVDIQMNAENQKDIEMKVEKPSDGVDIKMNAENQKDIEMKVEKPSDGVDIQMNAENQKDIEKEVEKPSDDVDIHINAENQKDIEAFVSDSISEDAAVYPGGIKNENLSEPTVSDCGGNKNESVSEPTASDLSKKHEDEGGLNISVAETHLEHQNDECETENVKLESQIDDCHYESEGKMKENEGENLGIVNGLKGEVGLADAILMSGELEALERRRKRKKEIFVGGLDKETKEEDIRKVFGQVGEVTEVRLVLNSKTGKNKGFAFVRFASASDAKVALTKYHSVEICGKQCGTSANEGNDTLFLGNINKKWKTEDVIKILKDMGIEKIDKVTVMADPNKSGWNRGFAFLELETHRDAQIAYNKLQNKDLFGKHLKMNVAWAEPLIELDEEELLKVKSVYAEYLPSSWDEEKVNDYFKRFGEIENVTLAKNLRSSKRKDFAFVNYTTREAAVACIEAFNRDQLNDKDSKLKVKVSLAKPIPKGKQIKHVQNPTSKEFPQEKWKPSQAFIRPHEPRNKGKGSSSSNYYGDIRGVVDSSRTSTTSELVQLLREQASWRQPEPAPAQVPVDLDRTYPSPGRKRPFAVMGDDTRYSDPRGYPRPRFGTSYPTPNPSSFPQGVGTMPFPRHHQQVAGYTPEPYYRVEDYPSYMQRREPAPPYHGSNGVYRRY